MPVKPSRSKLLNYFHVEGSEEGAPLSLPVAFSCQLSGLEHEVGKTWFVSVLIACLQAQHFSSRD